MSVVAVAKPPRAAFSEYYLSSLVFRWNQPGDYFNVKTPPVSTLFKHRSARELYDKVSKYVKEEIFNSAYFAPVIITLDLSHRPSDDRVNIYNYPNNLSETGYELFKSESPPSSLPISQKEGPDNVIVALLEHEPWFWSMSWRGSFLNDDEIDLVRKRKLYQSLPTIV